MMNNIAMRFGLAFGLLLMALFSYADTVSKSEACQRLNHI